MKLDTLGRPVRSGAAHPQWRGGSVEKVCPCGASFSVKRSLAAKRIYCSPSCYHDHREATDAGKIVVACGICGKPFRDYPSKARKFCGNRCSGINAALHTPNKDTSLERKVEAVLVKLGVAFEKQKPLAGVALPDFYVEQHKLAIFADGAYWHSRPQNANRDKYVNRKLPELGYRVLRLPEVTIKSDEALYALVESELKAMAA